LIGALVLSGCSWLFRERIPDFPTARQQYEYATALFEVTEPLPPERDRGPWNNQENNPYNDALTPRYRERDYRNFIHAFEKVPERFPTDTDFRPLAMIRLGEFHHLLGEYTPAVTYYRSVISEFPDDNFLQATGLFGLGRVKMGQSQYGEANRIFMRLLQDHGTSEVPQIVELCERARQNVLQLRNQLTS
jgi:TolA-binding protein